MSHPNRTQNAALPAHSTSNAADRQFAVQEKIRELMRENKGMSYDEAYAKCKTLPDMQQTFNAMARPAEIPDPFKVQEITAAQRKAGAQFRGKVQTAIHQRGITFAAAWEAIREEEPELWEASGIRDPFKEAYGKINRPDLA